MKNQNRFDPNLRSTPNISVGNEGNLTWDQLREKIYMDD
jgi:hypothetical protein